MNSWLVQNRLMALRKPARDDQGDPLFKNVVWEKTRAYAVGFSSIYLNMRGRESKGIVKPGDEAERLKKGIAGIVKGLQDPKTGRHVVRSVYTKEELYSGPFTGKAPDLIIGFEPGYRASWQTAMGGVPPRILDDNTKKWSGDHIAGSRGESEKRRARFGQASLAALWVGAASKLAWLDPFRRLQHLP